MTLRSEAEEQGSQEGTASGIFIASLETTTCVGTNVQFSGD